MRTLILFLIVISGCAPPSNPTLVDKVGFELELPDTSKGISKMTYQRMVSYVEQIGLTSLSNNVTDSMEVRLWYRAEVLNGGSVISVRYIDSKWMAVKYEYLDDSEYMGMLDTVWMRQLDNQGRWAEFIEDIHRLGIDNIQSQGDLLGWENNVSDGTTYDFEYATAKKYRYFSYNCPDVCIGDYTDCMRAFKLVTIFNDAFELNVPFGHKCGK